MLLSLVLSRLIIVSIFYRLRLGDNLRQVGWYCLWFDGV